MVTAPDDRPATPLASGVTLSPAELKSRRMRNIAIGLMVGVLVLLVYAMTIAKLGGPGVLNRPL